LTHSGGQFRIEHCCSAGSPFFDSQLLDRHSLVETRDLHELSCVVSNVENQAFTDQSAWNSKQIEHVLEEGSALTSLGWCGESLVAYALYRVLPPECELLRIAVLPYTRKKGYGTLLLRSGCDCLTEVGVSSLYLEVAATNSAALALYHSLGFESVGRRPNYYAHLGVDGLVLRCEL
jgi:ribosomal-protein-alanine N-acetyltransferase